MTSHKTDAKLPSNAHDKSKDTRWPNPTGNPPTNWSRGVRQWKNPKYRVSHEEQVSENKPCRPTVAMDGHGSEANGLEAVHFDVWQDILLTMLSIEDVFQLCAVSKSMQELLLNEYTFRRLCMQRYQLSPHLDVSYIGTAKILFIADKVASMCCPEDDDYYRNNERLLDFKGDAIVPLLSLALNPPDTVGLTPRWTNAHLLHPLVKEIDLVEHDALHYFPSIPEGMLLERCTPIYSNPSFQIEDITTLLLEICGSVEQYQEAIINSLQKDMPRLEFYLPYLKQSSRREELAKALHSLGKSDTKIYSTLGMPSPRVPEYRTSAWANNPYVDIAFPWGYPETDPVHIANEWLQDFAKLEVHHSVLRLLITGDLRTSQVDDYFTAVVEYEDILSRFPESYYRHLSPRCQDVYDDLGDFLLSSSQGQEYQKEWTKIELVDAMLRYTMEPYD